MKTSELIEFLKTKPFTKEQAYNLLVNDLWETNLVVKPPDGPNAPVMRPITEDDVAQPVAQALIQYFRYQIQEVLLPAITDLKQDHLKV